MDNEVGVMLSRFAIFIFVYLVIAVPSRFLSYNREIYPFFAWTLYTKTPTVIERGAILVQEVQGQPILQECNLYDFPDLCLVNRFTIRHTMRNWLLAVNKQDADMQAFLEKKIDSTIVSPKVTKYILVRETFDPLKKIKDQSPSKYSLDQRKKWSP